MRKYFNFLINSLTVLSLLAFVLICITASIHVIEINRPGFNLFINGDFSVSNGWYIKDPGWESGREPEWHTWLDGQARFITWHEPGEKRKRWLLKLPQRLLLPATAALPFIRGTIWLVLLSRFVRRVTSGKCGRCGYDSPAELVQIAIQMLQMRYLRHQLPDQTKQLIGLKPLEGIRGPPVPH